MQRRVVAVAVVLGLVAVAGLAVVIWFVQASAQGEQSRIRRRLEELTELFSNAGGQDGSAALVRLASLRQFFTEDVVVQLSDEIPELRGRDQLIATADRGLRHETGLKVTFEDIAIVLADSQRRAQANVTVLVTGVRSSEAKSVNARELEMDLVKPDGDWLIEAVRRVEVLELD